MREAIPTAETEKEEDTTEEGRRLPYFPTKLANHFPGDGSAGPTSTLAPGVLEANNCPFNNDFVFLLLFYFTFNYLPPSKFILVLF